MNDVQFKIYVEEMKGHVADTIKTTVNGKIDKIGRELGAYIEKDEAWKKEAQPAIDIVTNIRGFGKVALYCFGFIAAAGGAWLIIKKLF